MAKIPISWNELVKEMKKKNPSLHLSEVLKEAGKEWKDVKNGTHEKYIQGKSKPVTRKRKTKGKTKHKRSTAKTDSEKTSVDSDDHDKDHDEHHDEDHDKDHDEHHTTHSKTRKKHRFKKDLKAIYDKHKKILDELEQLMNEMKD